MKQSALAAATDEYQAATLTLYLWLQHSEAKEI